MYPKYKEANDFLYGQDVALASVKTYKQDQCSSSEKLLSIQIPQEKYITGPRHIEVQVMSGKNKTVHLALHGLGNAMMHPNPGNVIIKYLTPT